MHFEKAMILNSLKNLQHDVVVKVPIMQLLATSSDRTFKVAAIDSVAGLAWAELRSEIEHEAQNISVYTLNGY
jgi:hypothetical protein